MKLSNRFPPHIRSSESNFTIMRDVIIVLIPLYFLTLVYYGWRSILMMLLSVLVCTVADFTCQYLSGRDVSVVDLSAVVTGMLIPLMLSAGTEYKIVAMAGLFAILVAKQPFGGLGKNIFNPAAAGVAFACVSFTQKVFNYPAPMDKPNVLTGAFIKAVASPLAKLKFNGVPTFAFFDMLLGSFPGPMGATNILVLFSCLIYLVVRKTVNPKPTFTFLGVCALFAFLFPRSGVTRVEAVLYELMGGCLLFGAIFLLGDPTTTPKREASKILYAALLGFATMLFRYFGSYEEGIFFAVLLLNSAVWFIDMKTEETIRKKRREKLEKAVETVPQAAK